MPRGPRLDASGVLHHVMARGIDRHPIFLDDRDPHKASNAATSPISDLPQQTYDSLNRVETVTYPDTPTREVVTQIYDPAGNLKTVTGLDGGVTTTYVTSIQYDAFGKRTQMTLGNGTTTTYSYDASSFRLQQLATTGPGTTLQNLSYTYDAVGNVKSISDGVSATYNESFGYDDLHRLTSVTGPYGSLTYAYNQIGNMTCNSQLAHLSGGQVY